MKTEFKRLMAITAGLLLLAGSILLVRSAVTAEAETKEQVDGEALRSLESLVREDAKSAEAAVYGTREQRSEEAARIQASLEESSRQRAESIAASLAEASREEESRIAQLIWESESRVEESRSIARSAAYSRVEEAKRIAEEEESLAADIRAAVASRAEAERLAEESRAAESRAAAEAASRAEAERIAAESRAAESRAAESRAAESRAAETTAQQPVSTGQIVFVGDSRTSGFIGAGLMPSSRCLVFGGAVYAWYDNVRAAAAMQPSKVVFFGGQNDLGVYHGDANAFITEYTRLIRTFESLSPGTRIYCNLIFPCTDAAVAAMPGRENRSAYNAAIAQMCAENGWTCVDTTAGFNGSYFTGDGIHFMMNWYPTWWQNLRDSVGF